MYTGVVTDWTCDSQAEGFVSVGVSTERRAKVMSIIDAAVEKWSLTPAEASSLRGKARYCVCPVFGRVGLAAVTLLSKRQKATGDTSELDDELADVLAFLRVVIRVMPSFRVPIYRDLRPAIVVLTDASFATGHTWLGFFVHCPYLNRSWWAGMPTPPWLLALLASHRLRETYIGQIEGAVTSCPYFSRDPRMPAELFRGRSVIHYIDNQGALYSMINGRSKDPDMNRIAFVTLLRQSQLSCNVWFDYVPSASNIADLPTRLDAAAFARLEQLGERVQMHLPPESCLGCRHADLAKLFE